MLFPCIFLLTRQTSSQFSTIARLSSVCLEPNPSLVKIYDKSIALKGTGKDIEGGRRLQAVFGMSPEKSAAAIKSYKRLGNPTEDDMRAKILTYVHATGSDPDAVRRGLSQRPHLLLNGTKALLMKRRLADWLVDRHPPWKEELCGLGSTQRLTLLHLPISRLARLHFIQRNGWAPVNSTPISVILRHKLTFFKTKYHPLNLYKKRKEGGGHSKGLNKYLTIRERNTLLQQVDLGEGAGGEDEDEDADEGVGHWEDEFEVDRRKLYRGDEDENTWLMNYRKAHELLQVYNEADEFLKLAEATQVLSQGPETLTVNLTFEREGTGHQGES